MNRIERISRVRRLDRTMQRRSGLPADVQSILALSPLAYFDLRYPSLPGVGQVLWQDAARTTEVDTAGQAIGSVRNLGSLGGYAESSGTQRPLFEVGWDAIDDRLIWDSSVTSAPPITTVVWVDLGPLVGTRTVVDSQPGGGRHEYEVSTSNGGRHAVANDTGILVASGLGTGARSGLRLVWRADLDAELRQNGTLLGSVLRTGLVGQKGMILGANRAETAFTGMNLKAIVRLPGHLTAGQIASLPMTM